MSLGQELLKASEAIAASKEPLCADCFVKPRYKKPNSNCSYCHDCYLKRCREYRARSQRKSS